LGEAMAVSLTGSHSSRRRQLPAGDVGAKLIGWMREHPEYHDKDWVDCLDDAIAALKLCNH